MPTTTLTGKKMIALLGTWSAGPGPLHRRLAEALRGAVARGEIAPGTRLPAERVLARALSLSRGTVVAAYEALRQEDVLQSRQGSGTWVPAVALAARAGRAGRAADRSAPLRRNVVTQGILEGPGRTIPLLGAHVDGALGLSEELVLAALRDLGPQLRGSGYLPLGLPALREAVARHLTQQGLRTAPEQVLVTSGAQQAISLCAALFLQPGDAVALENPTYLTAIDIFTTCGARLLPVPLSPEGLQPERLREVIERGAPRLLYLIPTFHNPTGLVLPERQRREVVELAERTGVPVLEDLALAELTLGAEPPPPLAAFGRAGTVLTVGSMSKVFWAGLRVGWVRAEPEVVLRLARLKVVHDLGSSLLPQAVAVRLLADGARLRAQRRREVARGVELLTGLLRAQLPGWRFDTPGGGLCLWVRLPVGGASEFAQVALRHGVSVVPGPLASPDGGCAEFLRLPLLTEETSLREAVRRLSAAWQAYAPAAERQRATAEVLV